MNRLLGRTIKPVAPIRYPRGKAQGAVLAAEQIAARAWALPTEEDELRLIAADAALGLLDNVPEKIADSAVQWLERFEERHGVAAAARVIVRAQQLVEECERIPPTLRAALVMRVALGPSDGAA